MSMRLALFFAIPSALLFSAAHLIDIDFLLYIAIVGLLVAGIIFSLDYL